MANTSLWIIAFVMLFNSFFSDSNDTDGYRLTFIAIMAVLAICEAIEKMGRFKDGEKRRIKI
jgi:hypothetical protein